MIRAARENGCVNILFLPYDSEDKGVKLFLIHQNALHLVLYLGCARWKRNAYRVGIEKFVYTEMFNKTISIINFLREEVVL